MDLKTLKEMKELVEAMKELYEVEARRKPSEDERRKSNEEKYPIVKEFNDMMSWAFGVGEPAGYELEEAAAAWKKQHPTLPELIFVAEASANTNLFFVTMQIAPHWKKHKE